MQIPFNLPELTLLAILTLTFLIQLWFMLFVHLKLARIKVAPVPGLSARPLSVIICARNESENLQRFLPAIFGQNYPEFEVVVVNDRSWDGTREVLEELSKTHKNLKVVNIRDGEKFIAGKKFAVSMGIKAAKHEWLVFTDADCEPASENWLAAMQPPEDPSTEILLGYSPYFKKFGLLNVLIRFETFFTAINYLSFALRAMPYMGVGRNLAYKKSLFFKNKGFAAHMHIPSGDDDLFVNANASKENTAIVLHRSAHVWSLPQGSLWSYLKQKKRHFGAGRMYKPKHKFILSLQIISQVLFYGTFTALCFFKPACYAAFGIMGLSLLVRCFIYPVLLKRLNYGELRWFFPILDVLLYMFLMLNAILSIFVKKVQWK